MFQKSVLAQYFTTSRKISKAANCFELSSKSRGSQNHKARARYRSSLGRLDIFPKYGKAQKRFLADKRECFDKYACCKKLIRRFSGNGLVAKRNSQY